ncbi:MAG: hypothetical protein U5K56_05780 [Halioglobus sp.]|nr:hypothetical protein [Halioglobus sp.]
MNSKLVTAALCLLLAPLLLGAGAPCHAAQADIQDLRIGLNPGRTRIVFDLSGPARYHLSSNEERSRVTLEFPSATPGFDHRAVALRGTPIARIRTTAPPEGGVRYIFDLRQPVEPEAFALKPYLSRGHRVVIDLHKVSPAAADTAAAADTGAPAGERSRTVRAPSAITPQSATSIPNPVSEGLAGDWSGSLSLDTRLFFGDAAYAGQDRQNASVAFQPEYFIDWDQGRQRFAFTPFVRYDANDEERTHADIRELFWRMERDRLLLKAGVSVVFWGVTESQHLVDIINQTDFVENIDTEDKLGQPMLNLEYLSDGWGTFSAFVLPWFRERTFPGSDGRLRTQPPVDTGDPLWDSGDEEKHIDYALRWSHFIGDWDFGLAHFTGTARTPLLIPAGTAAKPVLRPLYLQIDQTSLDVQATTGAWLWKLEALYNANKVEDYFAAVGGFEYTWFGAGDGPADIGWLLEYNYDERGEGLQVALQDDLFAGVRLSGNDVAGTRVLGGLTVDLDNGSTFGNIEAARRLGDSWTVTVEVRTFFDTDRDDPLHFFRDDDYIELELERYF